MFTCHLPLRVLLLPEGGELEVTTDFLVSLFLIYDILVVTFP